MALVHTRHTGTLHPLSKHHALIPWHALPARSFRAYDRKGLDAFAQVRIGVCAGRTCAAHMPSLRPIPPNWPALGAGANACVTCMQGGGHGGAWHALSTISTGHGASSAGVHGKVAGPERQEVARTALHNLLHVSVRAPHSRHWAARCIHGTWQRAAARECVDVVHLAIQRPLCTTRCTALLPQQPVSCTALSAILHTSVLGQGRGT